MSGNCLSLRRWRAELHLRKIDLADEVLILNVAGYVRFLEPISQPASSGY